MKQSRHGHAANLALLALLTGCGAEPTAVFSEDGGDGSVLTAMMAAVLFLGGLLVERILLAMRPRWYFQVGLLLSPPLVSLPYLPEGQGRTATISWEAEEELARFWSEPGARRAPMGLHGSVRFLRTRRGDWQPEVRWSPPWSPVLAALWLVGLGAARGEAWLTLPIALAMVAGVFVLYRRSALRAAAELRWRWVSGRDEESETLLQ